MFSLIAECNKEEVEKIMQHEEKEEKNKLCKNGEKVKRGHGGK